MKILIVSDTHGRLNNFESVIKAVSPIDYLIHCGDVGYDPEDLERVRELAGCPCSIVQGNNDIGLGLPEEEELAIAGRRILIVHGHRHGLYRGYETLREIARERHCDVAMFGHTHVPVIDKEDPAVTVINPGSLTFPRQPGRRPSYIVMSTDRRGEVMYTLNYLEKEERGWFF